ncbi:PhzF family phenazine biosynthesis protein [Pseudooctadecabacter jejudonensis]|uniref:Trans-2,3-dihydro-3-hydroxyanthranilate isomerase n=1 Tax=Pseudooctadecabacter jejudonensis TaxID=1391910 RepID=A0A1Y5TI21_9RHOB|nr:PhzF family phenazine biosynthesis protein [Pseudooctadecabacter jejudonensis]SLN60802.1 Trans-2,3-dihydro-3-hydroxyanthranilate isomerase [Pseudooctadecabacter jejudonensis]
MQCDVFSTVPTGGNGLAVVLDGDGLTTDQMQAFARWTNLAETTFICPPTAQGADYDLRIFTPAREMKFAGHPTLGSAQCWLEAGHTPARPGTIVQNCGVGLVEIDLTGDVPAFIAPPTAIAPMDAAQQTRLIQQFNLDPARVTQAAVLDNGPVWHVLELTHADDVLAIDLDAVANPDKVALGLIAPHDPGAEAAYEVRMFGMIFGIKEDPITGSLNAALAHWFQSQGRADAPYVVAQGTKIGRQGRVFVRPSAEGAMRIGGHTNVLIKGTVKL